MQRRVCRLHVYVNFEVFIKSISHFWILWTASLFVDKGPVLIENQHRILSFIQDFGTQTNSYRCYNMVNLRNLARSLSNNSLYDNLQSPPHPDDLDDAEIEVSRDGIEGKQERRTMMDASEREELVNSTRLPERFGRRRSMGDKSTSFRLLSKEQPRSRDNRTEEEKFNDSIESIPDIHVAASTVFKLEPSATSEKKSLLLGEGTSLLDCAAAAQPPMIKPSTSSRRLTRGPSARKLLRAQSSRKVMGERSRSLRQLDSNTTPANKNDLRRQNSTKSLSSFNEDDLDSCFHESSHSKSSHKRDAPQRTASTSSKTIEKKKKNNQKKETSSNKSKSGHSRKLLTNMIESTNDVRVVRDKSERSAHQPFLQLEVVIPSPN